MVADAYQRISTHSEPTTAVIPANAGIQYLGMDSGSPFHSARNDGGVWDGRRPMQMGTFPHLLPSSVIPAKAGIQRLGMDSGSPFHSARNDGKEQAREGKN